MDLIRSLIDKMRPVEEIRTQYFTLECETNGFLPFNTATVKIHAFNDTQKQHRMHHLEFQWFRMLENRNYKIDNKQSYYNFSLDDVGYEIMVAVTNLEKPEEVECLTFGPIMFGPEIKIEVERMVMGDLGSFEVQYPYKYLSRKIEEIGLKPDNNKQCIEDLEIDSSFVTFFLKGKKCKLPLNNCDVGCINTNVNILRFKLVEKHDFLVDFDFTTEDEGFYCFYLKFMNRLQRDIFIAVRKLFLTIKTVSFDKELNKIELTGRKLFSSDSNHSVGDILILQDNLRDTLHRNVLYTKSVAAEKDRVIEYNELLEEELKATLRELRGALSKAKMGSNFEVSEIRRLESSMIIVEQKIKDNSFQGEFRSHNMFNQARFIEMKEELSKVKKLNQLLAKELKNIKSSRNEHMAMFQKSTNQKYDISVSGNTKINQTDFGPVTYYNKDDKICEYIDTSRNMKNPSVDVRNLQIGNETLKKELEILKQRFCVHKEQSIHIKEGSKSKSISYLRHTREKSKKTNIEQSLKVHKKCDALPEVIDHIIAGERLVIIDPENSTLSKRIEYLERKIATLTPNHKQDKSIQKPHILSADCLMDRIEQIEVAKSEYSNILDNLQPQELDLGDLMDMLRKDSGLLIDKMNDELGPLTKELSPDNQETKREEGLCRIDSAKNETNSQKGRTLDNNNIEEDCSRE